jgi:hypothetical protein
LFAVEEHVEDEATRAIYQRMIAPYRDQDRRRGRELMTALSDSLIHGFPAALIEVAMLGPTLKKPSRRRARLSTGPAPATAGSSTSAAPRSGSAT